MWTDHLRRDQAINASTTADIYYLCTRSEQTYAKRVARASERRDRAFGNTLQPVIVVAKHTGKWTARVEVLPSTMISCYSGVFFLDRLTQAPQVKARFCQ